MKNLRLAVAAVLFFCLPLNLLAQSFGDVNEDYVHYQAIEFLKSEDVVQGYPVEEGKDPEFRPDNTIIRAEALKMILEFLDIDSENAVSNEEFEDVPEDQWFYPYVIKARSLGVVQGYGDGTFQPGRELSVVEALKILIEAAEIDVDSFENEVSVFSDVETEDWFNKYVNFAQEKNIVIGTSDGELKPHRKITRGQLAEVIYRLDDVQKNDGQPFEISKNWATFEHERDNFSLKYPGDWKPQVYDDMTIVWQRDGGENERFFAQESLISTYIALFQDLNNDELGMEDYFDSVANDDSERGELNGLPYVTVPNSDYTVKWHFYLPNGEVLVAFVQIYKNEASYRESITVDAILNSLEYVQAEVSADEEGLDLMSALRANILVEGAGKNLIDQMGDGKIIETDTIGVGTGPVDYYYSEKYDVTVKYERASDLILDIENGQTSGF